MSTVKTFIGITEDIDVIMALLHSVYQDAKEVSENKAMAVVERTTSKSYMKMLKKAGDALDIDVTQAIRDDVTDTRSEFDV